jgi:hypothetical protein
MRLTKVILPMLATCITLSLPSPSAANTIVDTGTPSTATLWTFAPWQYFAGEFTVADAFILQTIEGYFDNRYSAFAGTVDIAIHDDGGDVPGATLFVATTPVVGAFAPLDWYGVSGLNWELAAGTYWASFKPSSGLINGTMPGFAPHPLSNYANSLVELDHVWQGDDTPGIGLRINYQAVPDSTSTLSLFMGVALLGFVAQRLGT